MAEQKQILNFDGIPQEISRLKAIRWNLDKQADKHAYLKFKTAALFISFVQVMFTFVFIGMLISKQGSISDLVTILLVVPFASFVLAYVYGAVDKATMRAEPFAQNNKFYFAALTPDAVHVGSIFDRGYDQLTRAWVSGVYNRKVFTIFNYEFTEGTGKSSQDYKYGVVEIPLPRQLPNVLFDNKTNNNSFGQSNITTLDGSQKLQVEGDFNNVFDIYVPSGYGRDVLYFLTPELMALLVDHAEKYDLEVVDNTLYLYHKTPFEYKTAELQDLFETIELIGGEFRENVNRYADERVANRALNQVAQPGQRLKRGFPLKIMISLAAFLVWIIWISRIGK